MGANTYELEQGALSAANAAEGVRLIRDLPLRNTLADLQGKIADLVLLGGNPLEDIRNLRTTELVIMNGRLVTVEQLLRNP